MNDAFTIFSLIHQTLSGRENKLSVSMMCQTAGGSRAGYYAWLSTASARQAREKHRIALILSWFWRHTTGGDIPKGHGASICASSTTLL